MQQRRGTVAFWTSENPTPLLGEICLVQVGEAVAGPGGTTWYKCKIGDGVTAWTGLPYANIGDGNALVAALSDKANTADLGTAAAADTGDFEPAGAVSSGIGAHVGASDPHGDRAYADGIVSGSTSAANSYTDIAIANAKVGIWNDRGNYDASSNVFPTTGGSGTAGAILKGDVWTVSVVGTLGGAAVDVGDTVRATVDSPANVAGDWAIAETNVEQATEVERGTLKVISEVDVAEPGTSNNTDAVTGVKWWKAFDKAITVASFYAAVRGVLLAGLSTASNAVVTASDSVLEAIGKLQAQVTGLQGVTINYQTSASYTLQATDIGTNKLLEQDRATAIVTIIPSNTTLPLANGSIASGVTSGDGQVTITPDSGVTLIAVGGALKTAGKGAPWSAVKKGTNTWLVFGALTV